MNKSRWNANRLLRLNVNNYSAVNYLNFKKLNNFLFTFLTLYTIIFNHQTGKMLFIELLNWKKKLSLKYLKFLNHNDEYQYMTNLFFVVLLHSSVGVRLFFKETIVVFMWCSLKEHFYLIVVHLGKAENKPIFFFLNPIHVI